MTLSYVKTTDLPQVIPVFPLLGAMLLPRGVMPLNIFEPRYLNMFDDALSGDRLIGMIQPTGGDRARPDLARIGCIGRITSFAETPDGRYLVSLTGICRFLIDRELQSQTAYRQVKVSYEPFGHDLKSESEDCGFERERFLSALKTYMKRRQLDVDWTAASMAPLESLTNSLSMALPFEPAEKQALLEAITVEDRLLALMSLLELDTADPDGGPTPLQ